MRSMDAAGGALPREPVSAAVNSQKMIGQHGRVERQQSGRARGEQRLFGFRGRELPLASGRSSPGDPAAGFGAGEDAAGAAVDRAHRRGRRCRCAVGGGREARPSPASGSPARRYLFGVLILANASAAARLVTLVLRGSSESGTPPTVSQLLVGCGYRAGHEHRHVRPGVLAGRRRRTPRGVWSTPCRTPTFSFPRPPPRDYRLRIGSRGSPTTCTCRSPTFLDLSPTDTLPLTIRVKGLMALQSVISLAVLVVVLARVINILPS